MRRAAIALLAMWSVGCTPRQEGAGNPPPGKQTNAPPGDAVTELADIERIVCAHRIAPEETLAVRLLGTVGPDGSWALDRVTVESTPDGVVLIPRVRRVPGDNFIQMLIPLDRIEAVKLPAGTQHVRARGRGGELEEIVRVEPGVLRAPPEVVLRSSPAVQQGDQEILSVSAVARVADGFVARIEMRQAAPGGVDPWSASQSLQAEGDSVVAWFTVRRPAGDAQRRIDVRAVDGQGEISAPPASLALPAR